jgi:peptide/nickel transport system substrate-binding protein
MYSAWGIGWVNHVYRPDHPQSVEPPEPVREILRLHNELRRQPPSDRRSELMGRLLDHAADEFFAIGTGLQKEGYLIAHRRLRNFPRVIPNSWSYPTPAPANPCQFFLEP